MIHNYDTTSEELKPCPFCGGTPVWHIRGALYEGKRTLIVKCQKCGTEQITGAIRLSTEWLMQTAKDKWNSRTTKKFDIPGYENVIIHEGNTKGGFKRLWEANSCGSGITYDEIQLNTVYNMDCLQGLWHLPDNSVDCCITSPPYYGLRDYGVDGQIGLEKSPDEYVAKLTDVFREVYRVLKPTGTLWLIIGDSYAGSNKGAANYPDNANKYKQGTNKGTVGNRTAYKYQTTCKDKDLIGIPWMLAFALRDMVGFYLRQDIIWHKPNPMPESVLDRCTKAHEYIFLFSKSSRYYFNHEEMQEQAVYAAVERQENPPRYGGNKYTATPDKFNRTKSGNAYAYTCKRNKRSVWTVSTKPDKSAHFAAYPKELIEPCVLAGCPNGGVVLDPFMGTGTTAMVARMYGRNFIGFELNADYMSIINKKIQVTPNIFYMTKKRQNNE